VVLSIKSVGMKGTIMEILETDLEVFIENRFRGFRNYLEAGGSHESIEAQAITVLEMEVLIRAPEIWRANQGVILDSWQDYMDRWYKTGNVPLGLRGDMKTEDFAEAIIRVAKVIRSKLYGSKIQAHRTV
jgi:hypothetical protein